MPCGAGLEHEYWPLRGGQVARHSGSFAIEDVVAVSYVVADDVHAASGSGTRHVYKKSFSSILVRCAD